MYNYSTIYLFKISIRTGDATPQLEHPVEPWVMTFQVENEHCITNHWLIVSFTCSHGNTTETVVKSTI